MKKLRILLAMMAVLAGVAVVSSCSDDDDDPEATTLTVVATGTPIAIEGGEATITITSNSTWTITKPATATWLTLDAEGGNGNGTVTATAVANTGVALSATLTVTAGTGDDVMTQTVIVRQNGIAEELTLGDPTPATVVAAGGNATFSVTSNLDWTVSKTDSWVTLGAESGSGDGTVTVTVAANTATSARTATITVAGGTLSRTVSVAQAAASGSNGRPSGPSSNGSIAFSDIPANTYNATGSPFSDDLNPDATRASEWTGGITHFPSDVPPYYHVSNFANSNLPFFINHDSTNEIYLDLVYGVAVEFTNGTTGLAQLHAWINQDNTPTGWGLLNSEAIIIPSYWTAEKYMDFAYQVRIVEGGELLDVWMTLNAYDDEGEPLGRMTAFYKDCVYQITDTPTTRGANNFMYKAPKTVPVIDISGSAIQSVSADSPMLKMARF